MDLDKATHNLPKLPEVSESTSDSNVLPIS